MAREKVKEEQTEDAKRIAKACGIAGEDDNQPESMDAVDDGDYYDDIDCGINNAVCNRNTTYFFNETHSSIFRRMTPGTPIMIILDFI